MRDPFQEPYSFKFHWLNERGAATGMLRKRGRFDGEILTLEKTEIPAAAIVQSVVRDNRMVLAIHTADEHQPVAHLLLQPSSKRVTSELKSRLDVARSRFWAKEHREVLRKNGAEHTYRDAVCPACGATLVLSDMPCSPQLYCHFCDALTTIDATQRPVKDEKAFRLCDECGMYSKPQKFTILYIYFLVFVFGWWSKPTWRCPGCMRSEAWKMLFGNFLFVLGLPVAIAQLIRCYGGEVVQGAFNGLDTANLRACRGDLAGALDLYRGILERVPHSAGVKYNVGMALLAQGNKEQAAEAFELALDDCSNYVPAYQQLKVLYSELGKTEQLDALERAWSSGEDDEQEYDSTAEAEMT